MSSRFLSSQSCEVQDVGSVESWRSWDCCSDSPDPRWWLPAVRESVELQDEASWARLAQRSISRPESLQLLHVLRWKPERGESFFIWELAGTEGTDVNWREVDGKAEGLWILLDFCKSPKLHSQLAQTQCFCPYVTQIRWSEKHKPTQTTFIWSSIRQISTVLKATSVWTALMHFNLLLGGRMQQNQT